MIEFLCPPELKGLVPDPVPAKSVLPEWVKRLKIDDVDARNEHARPTRTIRACMPFMDALGAGWIIPAPASVHIWSSEEGETRYSWDGEIKAIDQHGPAQVKGGIGNRMPLKWINPWLIRTAPGWSVLFVPPLNRGGAPFECMAGVVDCDRYPNQVNFPFVMTRTGDVYVEQGTPLVQVIPFRRQEAGCKARVGVMSPADAGAVTASRRKLGLKPSWYRLDLHVPKLFTRVK